MNSNNIQSQAPGVNNKWVINSSNTPLNPAQESLLSKGPNYAVAPGNPPNVDYIAVMETVCQKLMDQDVEELRTDINGSHLSHTAVKLDSCLAQIFCQHFIIILYYYKNWISQIILKPDRFSISQNIWLKWDPPVLRKAQAPKPNLTKEERKALVEIKRDKDRIILTADKGVAMVVLERKEYIEKAENLLVQAAYRTIERDPTNKLKAKLITILRRIKRETGMEEGMYKAMYSTSCTPRFYGLPKIHKTCTPLRPIVPSRGSATYGMAKVLDKVLKPLVGKSTTPHTSTRDFVNRIKWVTLLPGEHSVPIMSLHCSPLSPQIQL